MNELKFACPRCSAALDSNLACPDCGATYECKDGIFRFLLPEREAELEPFLVQYLHIRQREGNIARSSDYYRSLPMVDASDGEADRWHIRRQSYERLLSFLSKASLPILDLGAGNGWLTNRLTALGHCCIAVDISVDSDDGLGAWRHYPITFTCVQADFDSLPFSPNQFEVVIFNASLHYSPDFHRTVAHAQHMLKTNGRIFVIDSPTFQTKASGEAMLDGQAEYFRTICGLKEVIRHGIGYLTVASMREFGFRFYPSRGELLWGLRRLWSGVKLQRAPAAFGVWVCKPQ